MKTKHRYIARRIVSDMSVFKFMNTLNTINLIPANTVGYVGECSAQNSTKQKRYTILKNVALNSIFECVSANNNNKLYLQEREIQTLSVPALGTKVSTFFEKVLTYVAKFNTTRNKRYANLFYWHIHQKT